MALMMFCTFALMMESVAGIAMFIACYVSSTFRWLSINVLVDDWAYCIVEHEVDVVIDISLCGCMLDKWHFFFVTKDMVLLGNINKF